jgi:hypothetical protein
MIWVKEIDYEWHGRIHGICSQEGGACCCPWFSGYIAQEALTDGAQIDSGTVALGLVALAATAVIAAGGVFVCVKGFRAIGRRLCAGKAIRAR